MTVRHDGVLPARVYLTGFMGSGKSTVAPLLAGMIGYQSIDIDAGIEEATGLRVGEIFARDGEAGFRRMERAALFATSVRRSIVVAAGGGAIAGEESVAFVRAAGALVYLRVDVETLAGRLKSMGDRPMLAMPPAPADPGDGDALLRATIRRLLAEREPFYRRADVVVDAAAGDPRRTASLIAEALAGPGARWPRPPEALPT
jgi:shikimate kinase